MGIIIGAIKELTCTDCGNFTAFVNYEKKQLTCPKCNGNNVDFRRNNKFGAAPALIQDSIPATWHPANGKLYDSKSEFRRVTKQHGMVEAGNDVPTEAHIAKNRERNFKEIEKEIEADIGETARDLFN